MDRPDINPINTGRDVHPGQGDSRRHNPVPQAAGPLILDESSKDQVQRFAGVVIGLTSVFSEHILSHPCMVLRRQCQVHNTSRFYHFTPFTLFHTVFQIQRHQGVTTLWKGLGSALMVKGIVVASESALSEFTPLRKCPILPTAKLCSLLRCCRDVDRHSPAKKISGHLLLKSLSLVLVTPFCASSLVETVQSEIAASERPGVFDCLIEGVARLTSFTSAQPTRLLPVWKLLAPTVLYGLCHYVVSSLAKYQVSATLSSSSEPRHDKDDKATQDRRAFNSQCAEVLSALAGRLLADALLYPLETVLHRLYLQGTRTIIDNTDTGVGVVPIMTRYESALDCYHTLVNEEGVAALYKGFGALLLQYALQLALLHLTRCLVRLLSSEGVRGSRPRAPREGQGTTAAAEVPRGRTRAGEEGGDGRLVRNRGEAMKQRGAGYSRPGYAAAPPDW